MTTYPQNRKFLDEVLGDHLNAVLDWIAANLDPTDVFDPAALTEWAEDNGYVQPDDETRL